MARDDHGSCTLDRGHTAASLLVDLFVTTEAPPDHPAIFIFLIQISHSGNPFLCIFSTSALDAGLLLHITPGTTHWSLQYCFTFFQSLPIFSRISFVLWPVIYFVKVTDFLFCIYTEQPIRIPLSLFINLELLLLSSPRRTSWSQNFSFFT